MTDEKNPDDLDGARKHLLREFLRAHREGDGCLPEADTALNEASRRVVEAMRIVHGEAWLGSVNLYAEDRGNREKAMWKWDGSLVYNFGAAFVAPKFDEELVRLIMERDGAPYKGGKDDYARIEVIMARIKEIGGINLVWT